ncbi:hypothetical protein ACN38_g9021, partial [Penicillium nordicum]
LDLSLHKYHVESIVSYFI